MSEPIITINGHTLDVAQALALRVAVASMLSEMSQPNALGRDDHGKAMVTGYRANLLDIVRFMSL